MIQWKKWSPIIVGLLLWMVMNGCSVSAMAPDSVAVEPTSMPMPRISEVVPEAPTCEIQTYSMEVPASKEIEVIEPLDRTQPIYEVYKNGWSVANATAEVQWMIRDLSLEYDLPEKMIFGLITKESTFVPDEESFDGGCWGLAQINPFWITAANITHFTDDYRDRDLCDPYDNLLTLAEMMCYARDTYGLDYTTRDGQVKYLYWHATGRDPSGVTRCESATKALGFADELVTLQS